TQPTLAWSQVSGNADRKSSCRERVSDMATDPTSEGSQPSSGFNVTPSQDQNSYAATLNAGITYYWEVHARASSLANAGFWTQGSFTTVAAVVTRLPAPTLTFPASGATSVVTQPTLAWSQVSGN